MSTPLAENPAVVDPKRTLNLAQKDALASIAFFRHQRIDGGTWQIGPKRFSKRTIDTLARLELVRMHQSRIDLTMGGKLAHDKLQGARNGTA